MVPGTPTRHSPTFDLQSHSEHSDGACSPAEVVARAAAQGVELLALSDHDTVAGISEAREATRRHGIRLSAAAELSAVHGPAEDLHILGYELDHVDPTLLDRLADWREDRDRRIEAMADRLEALGLALDRAPLERRTQEGKPLGRPHLAEAVLAHPANAHRLQQEDIAGMNALFPAYLVPGAPAYVARTRPTVQDAIEAIHDASGLAVWAHPFWDFDDPDTVHRALDDFEGLDGVEAFYVTHSEAQTHLLYEACAARDLLTTGSADFHGPEHERFHTFRAFETYDLRPRLGPIGENRPT